MKNRRVLFLTLVVVFLFAGNVLADTNFNAPFLKNVTKKDNGKTYRADFSTKKVTKIDNSKSDDKLPKMSDLELLEIKDRKKVFINFDNLINVEYDKYPVTVEVSKDEINLIRLPYPIKYVDSSKPISKIGDNGKEFTISLSDGMKVDLAIVTEEKTFMVTLVPYPKSGTIVNIIDIERKTKDACDLENSFDYPDLMAHLIVQASQNGYISGYAKIEKGDVYKYGVYPVKIVREFRGAKYSVYHIQVINPTNAKLMIYENMPSVLDLGKTILKTRVLAVYSSKEFVEPGEIVDLFMVVQGK